MKLASSQISRVRISVSELSNRSVGFCESDVESDIQISNRSRPKLKLSHGVCCILLQTQSYSQLELQFDSGYIVAIVGCPWWKAAPGDLAIDTLTGTILFAILVT